MCEKYVIHTELNNYQREAILQIYFREDGRVHKFADEIWQISYLSSFAAFLRQSAWNYWTCCCCCFAPGKSYERSRLQSWKILVFLLLRSVILAKRIWALPREGLSLLFMEAQKLGWRSIGRGNVGEWLVQLVCGPWSATFPSMIKYFVEK